MPKGPLGGPRPAAQTGIVVYVSVSKGSGSAFKTGDVLDNEDVGRLEENKQKFLNRYIWKDVRYISKTKATDLLGGASVGESIAFRQPSNHPLDKNTLRNMAKHSETHFGIELNESVWVAVPF